MDEHTQFRWMKLNHVKSALYYNFFEIHKNSHLQGMLFDAIIPNIGPNDEAILEQYIYVAIKQKLPTKTM